MISGLNDAGDFVGTYVLANGRRGSFASIGGNVIEIAVPGTQVTTLGDINNAGQIVGYYIAKFNLGFRRESDGTLLNPIKVDHNPGIALYGLNESNESVGTTFLGFPVGLYVVGRGKSYIYYNLPGSAFDTLTGINSRGFICGWSASSSAITAYILRRQVSSAP